jgi:ribonuclease Z
MDLDLVFLGTAASAPSPRRGLSALLARRGGERLLFDCGEGTQRQLMRSVGLSDIDAIYITHLHADHVLGLPGMLKTFNLRERSAPLQVAGPRGLGHLWKLLRPVIGKLQYDVSVLEIEAGWEDRRDGYSIEAFVTDHTAPSVGWRLMEDDRPGTFDVEEATRLGVKPGPDFGRLQRGESIELGSGDVVRPEQVVGESRRGRRIVYTGDTRACRSVVDASIEATVLVHEATFCTDEEERARSTGHSTARDAALTAQAAQVDMLVLTHLSSRYTARQVREEAREVFPEALTARDFDLVEVPFAHRGLPTLLPNGGRQQHQGPGDVSPQGASDELAAPPR